MIYVFRYVFVFAIISFVVFFLFKTLTTTKLYHSKAFWRKVRLTALGIVLSLLVSVVTLAVYINVFEGLN